jgi:CheY-like chemotaxis protein
MLKPNSVILIVDDSPVIRKLLAKYLDGCGYTIEFAGNGEEAWEKLVAAPYLYDTVLLDRKMPVLDGMEVLKRIKKDVRLKFLPVILQTALATPEEFAEGLDAGAYYYLAKPSSRESVRAVVSAAIRNRLERLSEKQVAEYREMAFDCLDEAHFSFSTLDSAHQIAALVSSLCPSSESARMGILELMLNAIEHGNLGITYEQKTLLIDEDRLLDEISARLTASEYSSKKAYLKFSRSQDQMVVTIQDEGNGFDWEPYLEISMERIMDNHGRGIAVSRKLAFTNLQYLGNGNCVQATISMKK